MKYLIYLLIVMFLTSSATALNFAGGNGTAINPYQITNWTALNETRLYRTSYFVLNANLSSSDADYNGIGNSWVPMFPDGSSTSFAGDFNGNNNTISDLRISGVGFFAGLGYREPYGIISNLGLKNISVTSTSARTGGLVGITRNGTINNCYVEGTITSTTTHVGGLVCFQLGGSTGALNILNSHTNVNITGTNYVGGLIGMFLSSAGGGLMNNCYTTGKVNGSTAVGGLVGYGAPVINNSYAIGNVTGTTNVGGLAGQLDSETSTEYLRTRVLNSYATGNVTGTTNVGGLAGMQVAIMNNSYATGNVNGVTNVGGLIGTSRSLTSATNGLHNVSNCYATGKVNGSTNIGGLVGRESGYLWNSYSTGNVTGITNVSGLIGMNTSTFIPTSSYWDINTSGQATSAGGINVTGKTTTEMKTLSTFSGWDMSTTTTDLNNGYPYLSWQGGLSTPIWLIYLAGPSNCWTKTGNILFIPTGCLYNLNSGVVGI
jgi:hypothetical protein